MAKILFIDDDAHLRDVLSLSIEDAGYEVITAVDGRQGYELIVSHRPDVVISDVNMPGLDGFALCRKLREAQNAVPVILLTSRDSEIDESLGLELGADDYVAKPFSTRVLLARVKSLLRREALRKGTESSASMAFVLGHLEMQPERLEVRYRNTAIEVTVTEFRLLEALTRRPGVVFSRDRLMDAMRGDGSIVADRIVDTYVRRLRRKFETIDPGFDRIETMVGAGYRWRDGNG
jgi:DNA-binding response OmpR family regulator